MIGQRSPLLRSPAGNGNYVRGMLESLEEAVSHTQADGGGRDHRREWTCVPEVAWKPFHL